MKIKGTATFGATYANLTVGYHKIKVYSNSARVKLFLQSWSWNFETLGCFANFFSPLVKGSVIICQKLVNTNCLHSKVKVLSVLQQNSLKAEIEIFPVVFYFT